MEGSKALFAKGELTVLGIRHTERANSCGMDLRKKDLGQSETA